MNGAVKLLVDGTILAMAQIMESRDIEQDYGMMAEAVKQAVKENLGAVMAEWKNATDTRLSEDWLRKLLNAQANEAALRAVEIYTA